MSGAHVNASPEGVRKLARALETYQRQVTEAGRAVQTALDRADWHDRQKDRFEERAKELHRHIDRFLTNEVATLAKGLNEMARKLEDIQRMRM